MLEGRPAEQSDVDTQTGPTDDEARASDGRRAAAFFDVDNTLVRGATMFHFARGLYRRGFLDAMDLLRITQREASYLLRGEDHEDIQEARTRGLDFIRGRSIAELDALCKEIYADSIADRMWPGVLEEVREHQEAGREVWLVTATPIELASLIAAGIDVDGALGTVAAAVDGVYTGELPEGTLHGPAKVEAVRYLAEDRELELEACYAYSDSMNDLPMLELVGHPYVVNPDTALRRIAHDRGWPLMDYQRSRRRRQAGRAVGVGAAVGAAAVAAGRRFNDGR
jgi:HAD superfamily hydrolase (TIGR01490 family)